MVPDVTRETRADGPIKTFPLRMERQCANACRVAGWLATHPAIERVYFPSDPKHPDAACIKRLFAPGLYGAMVSFERPLLNPDAEGPK